MTSEPKTLEALQAALLVLAQLVKPDMNIGAGAIYFRAVEAETKVRNEIERLSR